MFLITGLGNPGTEYLHTRHNIGFDCIDILSNKYNIPLNRKKFKGEYGIGTICDKSVILLKPHTYMNLSGESIIQAMNFFKIQNENLIVIQDDLSLDIGRIRIRAKGSAGGHNGIKNIILNLNSDKFIRIKVGIGMPKNNIVDYVLNKFSDEDRKIIDKVLDIASDAAVTILEKGVDEAMNKFNGISLQE